MAVLGGRIFAISAFVAALSGCCYGRAVNISNTWTLPEEGFPVFYRHFRDRISWYEADAVCQFHHGNLVTADSTSQYDAIRAYLKELDIRDKIWIGLSKTREKPNFTWTDYRPLTGEGHWQEAMPSGSDSLCTIMDPVADFLWRPLPCGGPEIAAFICELPIPSWAAGPKGCLFTELPSLTVLYFPEQSTVELTSDCGLDGTRRIACKGNADREELLRLLSCAISSEDFDDRSTKSAPYSTSAEYSPATTTVENDNFDDSSSDKTTKSWIWTSNTIDGEYGVPTRHRRETEDTLIPVSTKSSFKQPFPTTIPSWKPRRPEESIINTLKTVPMTLIPASPSSSTPRSQATIITSTKTSVIENSTKLRSDGDITKTPSAGALGSASLSTSTLALKIDSIREPQGTSAAKPAPSITEVTKINMLNEDKVSTGDNDSKEQDKADTSTLKMLEDKAAAVQEESVEIKDEANLGIEHVTDEIYSTIATQAVSSFKPGNSKSVKTKENSKECLNGTTTASSSVSSLGSSASTGATKDYPAAVDQGQLLDILDNGTMFDIIELNDTEMVQSESKTKENPASATPTRSTLSQSTSRPTETLTDKKTTTSKDTEKDFSTSTQPPAKEMLTTKFPKKYQLTATKKSLKEIELKKSNIVDHKMLTDKKIIKDKMLPEKNSKLAETKEMDSGVTSVEENSKLDFETKLDPAKKLEQELTKEFEMLPDIRDNSMKLNRTFRKDVPGEGSVFKNLPESPEINILNELNSLADEAGERENIEISFHDETENANITETIVFSSIKRTTNDTSKMEPDIVSILEHVENLDKSLDPNLKMIDPRLKILNQNLPRNNHSELIKPTKIKRTEEWLPQRETEVIIPHPDKQRDSMESSAVSKEKFLPKSLQKEVDIPPTEMPEDLDHTTEEEFGPFPSDEPKKMNRHRNLSKNNRKNFYPYFFSRMLG